jgi:hypothetical protein
LGSFYGTTGVALALVIVQMLLVYPVFKTIIARLIPISFGEYIKSIQKPVIINLLSAIPALAYIWLFNNGRIVDFTIVLGLYGITFIVLVGIFGKELIADVKKLR